MKYKKGTFLTIPNKEYLRGKPSEIQSIYFWICEHANDDGECFPSRKTLAKESGTGLRRLDGYIKQLEDEGFIVKTTRIRKGTKEKLSNLYQVMIINRPLVAERIQPSSQIATTPSSQMEAVTKSNINSTQELTILVDETTKEKADVKPEEIPYSFIVELKKLQDSTRIDYKIIHNYWIKKGMVFNNKEQFISNLKRNLSTAKLLKGYTSKEIDRTMDYCEKNHKDYGWTLETVSKVIGKVINTK